MRKFLVTMVVCLMAMVSAMGQKYTSKEVRQLSYEIAVKGTDRDIPRSVVNDLENKRDAMVSTFSQEEKTINFNEEKDVVLSKLDICGWWSKHSSSYTEEGEVEVIHYDTFYDFYLGNKEISKANNYYLTFVDGIFKKMEVAENANVRWQNKINALKQQFENINRSYRKR